MFRLLSAHCSVVIFSLEEEILDFFSLLGSMGKNGSWTGWGAC